jgi:hypothetical protein
MIKLLLNIFLVIYPTIASSARLGVPVGPTLDHIILGSFSLDPRDVSFSAISICTKGSNVWILLKGAFIFHAMLCLMSEFSIHFPLP